MNHKLARERNKLLVEYAAAHPEMGYKQIGPMFGVGWEYASMIGTKGGVKRPRGMAAPAFPQDVKEYLHSGIIRTDHEGIKKDLAKGVLYYQQIADKHGCSYDTVATVAQTNGLNPGGGHRAIVIPNLAKVIRYVVSHPLVPQRMVADKLKVNRKTFGKIMRRHGVIRPVGRKGKRYED